MRFLTYQSGEHKGLAAWLGDNHAVGILENAAGYPGDLLSLLSKGGDALKDAHARLQSGTRLDLSAITYLPPIPKPGKLICVGLNYRLHAAESGVDLPTYPTLFVRFPTSFVGHGVPLVRPNASNQFDYECELALVIGRGGRHIAAADALNHIAGYSAFNDGSLRDYQFKAPQWTPGKNFDKTGSFGPVFVTADELPPGAKDLKIETRVNGTVLQSSHTGDMVFDVPSLIAIISEVMTLEPGDVISTGTPSGVGVARKPQVFLKPGDICEVFVEGIGTLSNPVVQES